MTLFVTIIVDDPYTIANYNQTVQIEKISLIKINLQSEKYKILSEPQFKHIAASTVVGLDIKNPFRHQTPHPTNTNSTAGSQIYSPQLNTV